jgi:outer membrane lipoprotein carrier protein
VRGLRITRDRWRQLAWPVACCCSLAAASASAAAAANKDAAAERRVEQTIGDLHSLKSHFEQSLVGAHGEMLEHASGTLYIEKPNRFRWDYETGVKQLIVSDGNKLWLYDQELDQVTVRALGQTLTATPAMLLSGTGRVSDSFDISDLGRYDGCDWVRLLPKTADTDFREIRLGFAKGELLRMTLKDKLGQSTELEFRAVERNPALDPALFHFVPPAGVDVIGNPGS